MTTEYPELWQFLGGYLHQDWKLDYQDEWQALDDYLTGQTDDPTVLAAEIDRALSAHSDAELRDFLIREGSSFAPEGARARQWLTDVAATARSFRVEPEDAEPSE